MCFFKQNNKYSNNKNDFARLFSDSLFRTLFQYNYGCMRTSAWSSHYTPYLSTWACYRFLLINLSHHQHNSAKKCISPQLPSPVLQSRGSIQKTRDDLHTNPEDAVTPSSYWKNMCTWSIFGQCPTIDRII